MPDNKTQPVTIPVPAAGRVIGVGRDASFRAARAGEIPMIKVGRRHVVPVAKLAQMLGISPAEVVERAL